MNEKEKEAQEAFLKWFNRGFIGGMLLGPPLVALIYIMYDKFV